MFPLSVADILGAKKPCDEELSWNNAVVWKASMVPNLNEPVLLKAADLTLLLKNSIESVPSVWILVPLWV